MNRDYTHRNFRDPAFNDFALALGQLNLAWNDLHLSMGGLFSSILKITNQLVPNAIWASIKSDRAQRDMIRALLKHPNAIGYELHETGENEITWILGKIENLAERRNDFIHSPFVLSGGTEIAPFHGEVHKRGMNLRERDLLAEARWFYDRTTALRDYCDQIEKAIRDGTEALLDRPKSPTR